MASESSSGAQAPPELDADIGSHSSPTFQPGTWDLSVLTRVPVSSVEILGLGKLPIDPVPREAVMLTLQDAIPRDRAALTIVGTHMSHLTDGSPVHYRRLARMLPADDIIVVGDMNMPGLALRAMLPRLRQVARGRTWPAWRPVIQSDHILATPGLAARAIGTVASTVRGSDHLPVRARFDLA